MGNYKVMYNRLFNKITDVIEELQQIQQQTEELYINDNKFEIVLIEHNEKKKTHFTR